MKRIFLTLFMLILLSGVLNACQSGSANTITITEQDEGKTIELNTGDTLEVMLNGNITTGYNWVPGPQDPVLLEQIGDIEVTPESNLIGAPGIIVLKFRAIRAGQINFHLDYKQPWDEIAIPEQTFDVTVVIN